jgi:hypothetical protein
MRHHLHGCPECGKGALCPDPSECIKAKTENVQLLCEECARKRVSRSKGHMFAGDIE